MTDLTQEELTSRTIHRRAVDAVLWGVPLVSADAMRQAYFRAGASYNDIIWWPNGSDGKNQSLTVNTSVRYMYFFCNTKQDGPVVFDLPPAEPGASFYGTIEDAWFEPVTDVGFGGAPGKYLILPPDYVGGEAKGYIPVRPKTYNTMTLVRSILKSPDDQEAGDALVHRVKIYPLSQAESAPKQPIDMSTKEYDGLVRYDETFYANLARVLDEETVQPRDLQMMGMLLPLGIERGKAFEPNADTNLVLKETAAEALAWLVAKRETSIKEWRKGSKWAVPSDPIGPDTQFKWLSPDFYDVDSRAIALAAFFAPTQITGSGSFYLGTYRDSNDEVLNGSHTYRLHVSRKVPVDDFWAFTVYSQKTAALFPQSDKFTIDSLDKAVVPNRDGSVDVYIGPSPPHGSESNWVYTPPGEEWFPWFRAYGPQEDILNGKWELQDIEKLEPPA